MLNETTISNEEYYRLKRLEEEVERSSIILSSLMGESYYFIPDKQMKRKVELIKETYHIHISNSKKRIIELEETIKKLQNEKTIIYRIRHFINSLRKRMASK